MTALDPAERALLRAREALGLGESTVAYVEWVREHVNDPADDAESLKRWLHRAERLARAVTALTAAQGEAEG